MAEQQKNGQLKLGRYEIISKLGKGGMGTVYKAHNSATGRMVALKVLSTHLAKNEMFLHRFLREARSAASLNHPAIVQAIDAGEIDGHYFFAMEYVDGTNVWDILRQIRKLPENRALEIAREIAKALDYAHKAGYIHRDIKPDNILISKEGDVKLADFGLARATDDNADSVTRTGAVLGTPQYISPEQVRGQRDIDGRADIYSLGGTLYHMLTGRMPYLGVNGHDVMAKHLSAPVPNPKAINPEISNETCILVQKMMAKERKDRPPSGKAVVKMIDRIVSGEKRPWYKIPFVILKKLINKLK